MQSCFTRGLVFATLFDVVIVAVVSMIGFNVGWW
jgi:hypothetical protein